MARRSKEVVTSDPVFITVPEAVQKYGYRAPYVYSLVKKAKVSSKIVNRTIYVSVADMEKLYTNTVIRKNKFKKVVSTNVPRVVKTTNTLDGVLIILTTVTGILLGYILSGLLGR